MTIWLNGDWSSTTSAGKLLGPRETDLPTGQIELQSRQHLWFKNIYLKEPRGRSEITKGERFAPWRNRSQKSVAGLAAMLGAWLRRSDRGGMTAAADCPVRAGSVFQFPRGGGLEGCALSRYNCRVCGRSERCEWSWGVASADWLSPLETAERLFLTRDWSFRLS